MGVPTFYRWLCSRYPLIVKELKDAVDEETCLNDLDLTEPNINGEFDCLYLDMNGIIHPCCNPSGGHKPKDEAEMFTRVCDYIDRLYAMVRPRRLIYMAIDGVAPRAKMNQQRSRRYKTALEMDYNRRAYEIAQEEFSKIGYKCPEYIEKWDSNVITPGTPFMERLTMCLHAYIRRKFETDESWRSITVIFSDSNIPGEGEHKILEFIRSQRSNPEYNPNTRHVLYGSDADLIMLGLSTHESYFYIIREAVRDFKVDSPSTISIVYNAWVEKIKSLGFGHNNNNINNISEIPEKGPNISKKLRIYSWWSDIEIVDLSKLREYLNFDFNEIKKQIGYLKSIGEDFGNHIHSNEFVTENKQDFQYDFERCVDDFVFLCFFIGNDFLPNLPVFSIYKGSLDQILGIYIRVIPRIGNYLTLEGNIIPNSIIQFFNYLRDLEYEIIIQESRFNQRKAGAIIRGKINQDLNNDEGGQNVDNIDLIQNSISSSSKAADTKRPTVSASEIELLFGEDITSSSKIESTNTTNDSIQEKHENIIQQKEQVQLVVEEEEEIVKVKDNDLFNPNLKNKRRFDTIESYFQDHLSKLIKHLSEVEDYNEENILFDNQEQSSNFNTEDSYIQEIQRNSTIFISPENPTSILNYRLNYYNNKFKAQISIINNDVANTENARIQLNEISDQVCIHYLRGLSWVLGYYYHGVPSWDWYYPYHYAPYVIDIVEALNNVNNQDKVKESLIGEFELGKPFTQFEQLMSVLPPKSGKICLPKEFYNMMKDKNNPLSEFYPSKFKQDPNGNKQRWKWVALLPFIDQKILLETIIPLEEEMDVLSKYRNKLGCDVLYSYKFSPIKSVLEKNQNISSSINDMPIFGYIQNYSNIDLNTQNYGIEQVTVPIIETCENIQQGKEIITRMLNDDRNKIHWKSILESSFNNKINHPNYVIGYFKVENMEKKVIWKDSKNDRFQMFQVGFGSKMLPNSHSFLNSISDFELQDQERKFKGFKANQSQKILFKLFNCWNLNIDFKKNPCNNTFQDEYFSNNNYSNNCGNKRFREPIQTSSSFYSNKIQKSNNYYNYNKYNNCQPQYLPYKQAQNTRNFNQYNGSNYPESNLYDREYSSKNSDDRTSYGDSRRYRFHDNTNHKSFSQNRYCPSSSTEYPTNNEYLNNQNLHSGMRVTINPNSNNYYNYYKRDSKTSRQNP